MVYQNHPLYPGQSPQAQAQAATQANLPAWHGARSDTNRNARRRWRKKESKKAKKADEDRKTALEGKLNLLDPPTIPADHARNFTVFHVNTDQSQTQPESQSAAAPPLQDGQNRAENFDQARGGERQAALAPRRVDSWKIGDARSSAEASSQLQNKPALSASSTSAEIVEALMPDRPAPVRSPRRTASVDFLYKRKVEVRDEVVAWVAEMKAGGV